jgi:predicted transcriptional regulator
VTPLAARVSREQDSRAGILAALQDQWWTVKELADEFAIPKARALFHIRQIAVQRTVFYQRSTRMYRVFPQAFQVKAALRRVNR